MGDDAVLTLVTSDGAVMVGENDVLDDRTDAVINAEAGFIPRVEGEEDGVLGKETDAFGESQADK